MIPLMIGPGAARAGREEEAIALRVEADLREPLDGAAHRWRGAHLPPVRHPRQLLERRLLERPPLAAALCAGTAEDTRSLLNLMRQGAQRGDLNRNELTEILNHSPWARTLAYEQALQTWGLRLCPNERSWQDGNPMLRAPGRRAMRGPVAAPRAQPPDPANASL